MFNGTTFHSYMYAVLAGLICTSNKWANYHMPWQFSKSFHC